jgi:preprotein translocase subunit SecG
MYGVLLAIHLVVCVVLVAAVLLQAGKGGGLAGGAFGGTAQTVFGSRGATDFLTRTTIILGGVFFLTSLTLALISSSSTRAARSLIQEQARKTATQPLPQQGPPPAGGTSAPPTGPQAPPATSPTAPPATGTQAPPASTAPGGK